MIHNKTIQPDIKRHQKREETGNFLTVNTYEMETVQVRHRTINLLTEYGCLLGCYTSTSNMTDVSKVLTASIIRVIAHHPYDGGSKPPLKPKSVSIRPHGAIS
jgi:hypothetical protein